jgi:hypothetical protein
LLCTTRIAMEKDQSRDPSSEPGKGHSPIGQEL